MSVVDKRGPLTAVFVRVLLIAGSVLFGAPFVWMVSTSLKDEEAVFHAPPEWVPRSDVYGARGLRVVEVDGERALELSRSDAGVSVIPERSWGDMNEREEVSLDTLADTVPAERVQRVRALSVQWLNYPRALQTFPFIRYLFNTLFITVAVLVGTVLSCSMAAYGFSRLYWWGRDTMFVLVLSTLMIPGIVLLLPQFILFRSLGWVGTYAPLVVPHFFGNAFDIFLLRQFFSTIPRDLSDAARIDGAGELRILAQIILPLSRPALATVGLLTFTYCWFDFAGPLVYISDPDRFTLVLGLQDFLGRHEADWSGLMAASTVIVAPAIVLFLLLQRAFIQGVALTGLKA